MENYFVATIVILSLFFGGRISNKVDKKKEIIVTAPAIYNQRLCDIINADSTLRAIPFPVVETIVTDHNAEIDSVLASIDEYDWIVLPSRNAIKALFERAGERGMLNRLISLHYCAIGKDQEYLKHFGVKNILENTEASPQGIVKALKSEKSGKIAVLVPKVVGMQEPDVVPNFIDSLRSDGWQVRRVDAYTTKVCHSENEADVIQKIKNGQVDLIAFTSTGEIEALLSLVGGKENLSKVTLSCFGPYTYGNAEKLGLKPAFIAEDYSSFQGYVEAIKKYFSKK